MSKKFFVYVYMDPEKRGSFVYSLYKFEFEPFYIGKGGTCFQHLIHINTAKKFLKGGFNNLKLRKIRKILHKNLEPIILKFKENLTEEEAFNLEKDMIKTIGRRDLRKGPLTNLTDGGDGTSGYVYPLELRKKRSEAIKGYKHPLKKEGVVHHNKGKTLEEICGLGKAEKIRKVLSEKLKKRISENGNPMCGRKHTEVSKRKIGEKNSKPVLVSSVKYSSLKLAGSALGVDYRTIQHKIVKQVLGYKYL